VTPTDTTDAYVNDKRLDAGATPPGAFAFHSHHVPSATSAPSRTFRSQVQLLPLDFRIKVQGTAITPTQLSPQLQQLPWRTPLSSLSMRKLLPGTWRLPCHLVVRSIAACFAPFFIYLLWSRRS
jgi:hypothetical protein